MENWSAPEVELIVESYFRMLSLELSGVRYSKAEYRRALLPLLNNRSEGAVEFKYQNISAVLIKLGQPYIKGYLPRSHYQKSILDQKVIDHLAHHSSIELLFRAFADKEVAERPTVKDLAKLLVEAPEASMVAEPLIFYERNPIKTNYLEQEQSNSSLGLLGEKLALEFEKWNLAKIGKNKLASEVRWISQEEGDGAGFDILSKNPDGTDKYVEVKTTKLGKKTPFFFSRNELQFSTSHAANFHLFRFFNFEEDPRLFIKQGSLESICHSIPMTFKGYF